MREIGLKQADYFHKGFLTNFNLQKRIPIVTYFVLFYQNAITETKQVEPLTLMVSTKSPHLLPDNSSEAFNGFYCTWKQVKFRWKHFRGCVDLAASFFIHRGHFSWRKLMILEQPASVARMFAQIYSGTRKSLKGFWPPPLEQPIKFVSSCLDINVSSL